MRLRIPALPSVVVPLADQAIVSAGTFLFNMALARGVPLSDFGRFALVSGDLLILQTVCGSLIHYPLAVRAATLDEEARRRAIGAALISTLGLGLLLAIPLTAILGFFLSPALLPAVLAALMTGVLQEATRRGLLATFRYAAAIPGDALSYGGQAILLLAVAHGHALDLAAALWIMAATSIAASALQFAQIGLRGARPSNPFELAAEFWSLGRWPLMSNLLGLARTACIPWLLTVMTGPSAAGVFQIALNLVNVANPVVIGICGVVPQTAARAARFGRTAAWRACRPAAAAGLVLIVGFTAMLLAGPQQAATLIYGRKPEIADVGDIVRLLAVGVPFNYLACVLFAFLCGVQAGRLALVADVASTLFAVALVPVLAHAFGLEGAAAALALSLALRAAVLGVYVVRGVSRAAPVGAPPLAAEARKGAA